MTTYTIKKGDTLTKIAKQYNTTVRKLQELNPSLISDVDKISVGWVLKIPTQSSAPIRCKQCEAFNRALNDIHNLDSVRKLLKLIGD